MTRWKRWAPLAAALALLVGGATVVSAAAAPQSVPCQLDGTQLVCTLPAPPTVTTTATATRTVTVTAAPPTVSSSTPPSSSSSTSQSSTPPATGQPVITRSGSTLLRAGKPWQFVGFNAPGMFGCDGSSAAGMVTDANLDRYFRELPKNSVTRIWPYGNASWNGTLQRIVAAAERNQQYLLVTLSDANSNGGQCGSNKGSGYPANGEPVRSNAVAVVNAIKGSPAVMAWEIINEGSAAAADQAWYDSIAKAIRAADSTHLIAFGIGTCYNAVGSANWNQCKAANSHPLNDFVNMHEYDSGISWWLDEHTTMAQQINRPVLVGEFGFCCNGAPAGGYTADSFGSKIKAEWAGYLAAPTVAGALYWGYRGPADTSADHVTLAKPAWNASRDFTHARQG